MMTQSSGHHLTDTKRREELWDFCRIALQPSQVQEPGWAREWPDSLRRKERNSSFPGVMRTKDGPWQQALSNPAQRVGDRKSTRLNSSHLGISYAVFCLKQTSGSKYTTLSLHDALPI